MTYEAFRDTRIAYAARLILIDLLVVAQIGSYLLSAVIQYSPPVVIELSPPIDSMERDVKVKGSDPDLAAMLGALCILDAPIFLGFATSLTFGVFVSTLLTLVVIPVIYCAVMRRRFCAWRCNRRSG